MLHKNSCTVTEEKNGMGDGDSMKEMKRECVDCGVKLEKFNISLCNSF